jgi:energy-coupling factor transporter ATP-binding protein EcfA2
MASSFFKKADRKKAKLRLALDGPSGSGKTFTALRFAQALAAKGQGRIAVIDTEHGSAAKYVGERPDGTPFEFDHAVLENFSPTDYTVVLQEAGQNGYDVVVIDSLSHAWEGKGGALDQVDAKTTKGGNSFTAWKDVTPQHRQMVEAILRSPCHVICTMRSKTEYVLQPDSKTGKMVPTKIGLKPIQRDGMEYEFDVVCDIDTEHLLKVSKTRCPALDGMVVMKPGASLMTPLLNWLENGSTVDPSFYAVTEADLQTQVNKEAAEENLSPIEKLRRKNELKRQQQDQPATQTAPATTATDIPFTTCITPAQVERIFYLAKRIEMPDEVLIQKLAARGVQPDADNKPHPERLEATVGTEFLEKLEEVAESIVAEEMFGVGSTPGN